MMFTSSLSFVATISAIDGLDVVPTGLDVVPTVLARVNLLFLVEKFSVSMFMLLLLSERNYKRNNIYFDQIGQKI